MYRPAGYERTFYRLLPTNRRAGNNVLKEDWNRCCSVHAEINAYRTFKREHRGKIIPKDIIIVVIRVGKTGDIKSSDPCIGCQKYLTRKGVGKLYYS